MLKNKFDNDVKSENLPKSTHPLFLIASKNDIQLALQQMPSKHEFILGMHVFLESRYCIGSLFANMKRIEYRQSMPTIVGTGLQKLAIKVLSELQTFESKPIPKMILHNIRSLDACVGTLRSWNMDCDVQYLRPNARKTQTLARDTTTTNKNTLKSKNKSRRFKLQKNNTSNLQQTPTLKMTINKSGHRITIPDTTLFANFFHDHRHFISSVMRCLTPWSRDLHNARGVCLNVAFLCSSQTPGFFDAMTLQRVKIVPYQQQRLLQKLATDKFVVMKLNMRDSTKKEVCGMFIENRDAYCSTVKSDNMLLCCDKTYVFVGDGILTDGTSLHRHVSALESYSEPGHLGVNSSNAVTTKLPDNIDEVQNMIYKMRFLQAAMDCHQSLHIQKPILFASLTKQLKAMHGKIDPEKMAILRMLHHSFGHGLHALAALHS